MSWRDHVLPFLFTVSAVGLGFAVGHIAFSGDFQRTEVRCPKSIVVLVPVPPHLSNRVPPIEPEPELGPQLDQGQFNHRLPSQE